MTVTIKDIARKVGVNPSTVSRVINGTASISSETKEKIYDAMKELDYHPNSQARGLVNGSTFTIGLAMDAGNSDAYANTFFIKSVSAIEAVTQKNGYNLLITNDVNLKNENAVKNLILEHKVDGMILPGSTVDKTLVELMKTNEFPFVIMGEPEEEMNGVSWVDVDNEQGGRLAARQLWNSGYRNPVLLVENKGTIFERKRIAGFCKELNEKGITDPKRNVWECGTEGEQTAAKVVKMLHCCENLDSIICTNNVVAFHVMRKLKKEGIQIPDEIGIIAFDNYPLAEYLDPPLTVVDVDTYLLGEKAALVLFDRIKKRERKEENILISTQILERKSTRKEW